MPVDKNITTYDAAPHTTKRGLKGSAGGDVRGYNSATHTYSGGHWVGADTDVEGPVIPGSGKVQGIGLGHSQFGPVYWAPSKRWRKGDLCVYLELEYKALTNHSGVATVPGSDGTNWGATGKIRRNSYGTAGEPTPGFVNTLATTTAGTPATGNIKVTWVKPAKVAGDPEDDHIAGYELIAYLADNDNPVQIDVNGVTDPDDLLTAKAGSGYVLYKLVSADGAAEAYDNWDLSTLGVNTAVVVGVRVYTDSGARGPFVWATGTTNDTV